MAPRAAVAAPATGGTTSTNHTHRHGDWTAEVETLKIGIVQLTENRPMGNECRVSFFEVAGDSDLHVNVTHKYRTVGVTGWSGPATLSEGFLNNRRFQAQDPILQHIRNMVFAART